VITKTRKSVLNHIIEHVSDNVNIVVQAIADDVDGPGYREESPLWKERYPSIEDLNVLTATHVDDYLPTGLVYPDRYPAILFGIDTVIANPALSDSECFIGRLAYELYVNRENFKFAQREIFEIHDAIRSIILHDKSIGVINGLGGIVDSIQWLGFSDFMVDKDAMARFIVGAKFAFEIAFREDVNR